MNRHEKLPPRKQLKELQMDFHHKAACMYEHIYQMRKGNGDHELDQEELNIYYVDLIDTLQSAIEVLTKLYDQQNNEQSKEQKQ